MTLEKYYEILKKHRIRHSRKPSDEELASMTEEGVEDFCVKMRQLFTAAFNEKYIRRKNEYREC